MELLTLTSWLLLALSFVSANCASDQLMNLQKSLQKDDHAKITQLWLPRKLNLYEEKVKSSADEDFTHSKGSKQHGKEENAINVAEKGRESVEDLNKAEYFTMDYGWVKRRRPIHNKQVPFVP